MNMQILAVILHCKYFIYFLHKQKFINSLADFWRLPDIEIDILNITIFIFTNCLWKFYFPYWNINRNINMGVYRSTAWTKAKGRTIFRFMVVLFVITIIYIRIQCNLITIILITTGHQSKSKKIQSKESWK